MKALLLTTLLLAGMQLSSRAQQVPGQPTFPGMMQNSQAAVEELPKFDIEFHGGFPADLVRAIQIALQKVDENFHINVIIPEEFETIMLPPLKMRNVDAAQLFKALEFASQRQVDVRTARTVPDPVTGVLTRQSVTTRYGFRTVGPITPTSIWYFNAEKPIEAERRTLVRYYQLAPYLAEFTMDDIGSALEAGWNMLGETNTPKLNFHADTKLLIAVGTPENLEMINGMLKELGSGMTNQPATSQWKPVAQPRATN